MCGPVAGIAVFRAAKTLWIDGGLVRAEVREGNAATLLQRPRLRPVGHDPEDPRLERGAPLEARAAVEHADPRVLHDLLGDRPAAHVELGNPQHGATVAADERREDRLVPGPEAVEQRELVREQFATRPIIGDYSR